jgi:hypothetical protein
MELLEYHFSNLSGNLYYDDQTNTYEMFSQKGKPMHLNYLTFRELFKQMDQRKDLNILYPKIGFLSYLEEDLLISYKGYKKLFLFDDPIMFDSWTSTLFNEVYLFDYNTQLFTLIKYNPKNPKNSKSFL